MRFDVVSRTPNYIMVRFYDVPSPVRETLWGMDLWCRKINCGKRVSAFHFAFKTEAEYAMFLLRWR